MKYLFLLGFSFILFACGNNTPVEETKVNTDTLVKKDTTPVINPYKDANVEVVTYANTTMGNTHSGFGYDIKIDGKLYIHQPNIPALPGNSGFDTEEKAKKAGELVAYKIRNNIMPPSVTEHELDSVGAISKSVGQ